MAGIGSKPGERRGGRCKGALNKANARREAEIAKSGNTPLQFLTDRMRNTKADMAERIECAKAHHPKFLESLKTGKKDRSGMERAGLT